MNGARMAFPQQRRSNYWIKKSFQSSFSARFALLLLIEAVLIGLLFLFVSKGTLTTGYQGSDVRVEYTSQFFMTSFLLIASLVAGVTAGAGMLVFILFSHRIAGPAFHLHKALNEMIRGNLTYKIRLRKKDELGDLAQAVNLASQSLDQKIGQIKREISHADRLEGKAFKNIKELVDSFKTSS